MLSRFFENQILLGAAQVAAATMLAIIVILLARLKSIHMEREILVSMGRGLVQVVAVGSVLVLLFNGPLFLSIPVLLLMMGAGARIAARRVKGIPGVLWVAFTAITLSATVVISTMTLLGAIEWSLQSIIPVGSMIVAGAMNASALALERFRSELESHVGHIESGLALGAGAEQVVEPYVRKAIQASLIPGINSIRSLGIVWIPGLMAGMIFSGANPVYAALYQFVFMAMHFSTSALSSMLCIMLIRRHAFTDAEQLIVRPEMDR